MASKRKQIISWLFVVLWMGVIFFLSAMPRTESGNTSKSVISKVVETTVDVTNKAGITDTHPSEKKYKQISEKYNKPFRKCAHAGVYFILAFLVLNALNVSGIKDIKLYLYTLIFCFIYACTDEIHQLLVPGRSGEFKDVLIDTTGSLISLIIFYFISELWQKRHTRKDKNVNQIPTPNSNK